MAKDPAFLFYPGDYVAGTMHLNFECKGAYMDLLMLQFQKDHMTIHMIKQVLGHKFDHIWPLISDKFKTDGVYFWNERLRIEKEKRIRFTESRRNNRNSKKDEGNHMISHMENENENINTNRKRGVGKNQNGVEKAIRIDEIKLLAYFEDGSCQPLDMDQERSLKAGNLEPHYVRKIK